MQRRPDAFALILLAAGGFILLFLIAPIAGMFISVPWSDIRENLSDKEVTGSIVLTLTTAMGATLFFGLLSVPLAYMLSRRSFPLRKLTLGLINLPVVIPHSAAGIAVLGFISRDSLPGKAAGILGLEFVGNPIGISVAMAFVSVPFLINAAYEGFCSVPVRLEKAALSLGASPAKVFFRIALPLAWRNILSGGILMFARGMSEFGAVVIVAYHPMITPVLIFERFGSFGLAWARPVAVIFICISLTVFVLLQWLSGRKNDAGY